MGSDHRLVLGKVQLKLKRIQKTETVKPFAVKKLKGHQKSRDFKLALNNKFEALRYVRDIEEQWKMFREAVTTVAEEQIGRRGTRKEEWIQEKIWELIDERKRLKQRRDQSRTVETKAQVSEQYQMVDRQIKRSCRRDKMKWFEQEGSEAQEAANQNDTKTLYRIVKEVMGDGRSTAVPIKDKWQSTHSNRATEGAMG